MVKCLPAMWETRFDPWVGKMPWRRKWQPTPVPLPGKSHRQRSLVGCSPRSRKESDTTEHLHFAFTFEDKTPPWPIQTLFGSMTFLTQWPESRFVRFPQFGLSGLKYDLKQHDSLWLQNEIILSSESESCSIVSDSLRPRGLHSPWNSPGQNTGVGSRSLL